MAIGPVQRIVLGLNHPDFHGAALVLLEDHWTVPLRDAIARVGGFRTQGRGSSASSTSSRSGLVTAEAAQDLHALETTAAVTRGDGRQPRRAPEA